MNKNSKDFLFTYFDNNKESLLKEFFKLLSFKSISTDPTYKEDCRSCATWLKERIKSIGFTANIWETKGHPAIFAERIVNKDAPTVLFYNHYDVQPVDPIELWETPPFEPTIREDFVFARGAEDNKGQLFYVLTALTALKDSFPNINVKMIIEGEEECGSKSFPAILADHKKELKSDYLLVVDCGFTDKSQPGITLGCRGIVTMTIALEGSNSDLHSGEHGGIVFNPLHGMVELLATLRDKETGKILIENFYSDVIDPTSEERDSFKINISDSDYELRFGAKPNGGETNYSFIESAWLRPTLEINGISGGYAGEGFKTVIPAKVTAKLSARLVPNQNPKKIAAAIKQHLEKNVRDGLKLTISDVSDSGKPLRISPNSKLTEVAKEAYEEATGMHCNTILSGGSIPVTADLAEAAEALPLLIGYGLPEDNIHAPNENFSIDRLKLGTTTIGLILEKLSKK